MHFLPPEWFKVRRVLRRIPAKAWKEFHEPLFNRSQFLALLVGFIGVWIILGQGDRVAVTREINEWSLGIYAFAYAMIGWAIISVLRAPLIVISDDRRAGRWYGRRFVYHVPKLVLVQRCRATGNLQKFKFYFDDAEPNAFVYYVIESDHPDAGHLISACISSQILLGSDMVPGSGHSTGGIRINQDRSAHLMVVMTPSAVSQTLRVYCRDFTVGNPEDQDGDRGEDWRPV